LPTEDEQQAQTPEGTPKVPPPFVPADMEHAARNGKLGATQAILALVTSSPGLKTVDIAEKLADSVKTSATNVRRTLITTVSNLVKKGKLTREKKSGGVYPASD
jgi:hypothetical protein